MSFLHMRPTYAATDVVNLSIPHIIKGSYRPLSSPIVAQLADAAYVFFGEFCVRMLRTFSTTSSVFVITVFRIVSLSAKKQMRRTDTRGVVTLMTDAQLFRRGYAVLQQPRNSMSALITHLSSLIAVVHTNVAVAVTILVSMPHPAIWCFGDLSPKSLNKRLTIVYTSALHTESVS